MGNPNVGKTTLFNTLTKSNDKATNWHGVTVGIKSKKIKINDSEFNVVDIPGLYSLDPFSNEEKIACDYLCKHNITLLKVLYQFTHCPNSLNIKILVQKKDVSIFSPLK